MSELVYDANLGLFHRADPKSCDARIAAAAVADYSCPPVSPADVVLDLGAHIGSAAHVFLARGASVVCVEPDAGNLEILKRNAGGKAIVYHAAVAPVGVEVVGLWRHPERNAVHRTHAAPDRLPPVEVRAVSLEGLVETHRPTVIKCDIEHAEHELPMLRALPRSVRLLFMEIHGTPEQIRDLEGAILTQGFAAVRRREQWREGALFGVCAAYQRAGFDGRLLTVGRYKGIYAGRVAILCGGTTAAEQDLDRITCPILGVNESWRAMPYPRTFAHVLSDMAGAQAYGGHVLATWPEMPTFQKIWADGKMLLPGAIAIRSSSDRFSFDLARGAATSCAPVLALQIAIYLGFTDVVMVGLDLKYRGERMHWWDQGPAMHPDRSQAERNWRVQAEALRDCARILGARPDVRVRNVSHDTNCDAFELAKFDEVFA